MYVQYIVAPWESGPGYNQSKAVIRRFGSKLLYVCNSLESVVSLAFHFQTVPIAIALSVVKLVFARSVSAVWSPSKEFVLASTILVI